MTTPELVRISDGDSICTLCPSIGGSIFSWSVGNQDMLRRANIASLELGGPTSLASFPLVPFSNRVGYARFVWAGRQIDLFPNFAPEPHAIHGTGWKDAWAVETLGINHCTLILRHEGDARWPWSFYASQCLSLNNHRLELKLTATNLSDEPAPLAFGHHPYFDVEGAQLTFGAARILMSGDDNLPTQAVSPDGQFDFRCSGAVDGREIDHCYAGWDGRARIQWTERPLALEIVTDMKAAVVFIPKGGNAFCFEPVPHINNALNRADDMPCMPTIAPGESFTATIHLDAVPK